MAARKKAPAKRKVPAKKAPKKRKVQVRRVGDRPDVRQAQTGRIRIELPKVTFSDLVDKPQDTNGLMGQVPFKSLSESARENSILKTAQDLIFGDREQTYGAPDQNLKSIAAFWTTYLDNKTRVSGRGPLTIEDVCQMMILLKTARLIGRPTHRDSLVDQAGYAALQQRCHDEQPF